MTAPVLSRLGPHDVDDAQRLQAQIARSAPRNYVRAKSAEELAAIFSGSNGAGFGLWGEDGALIAMGLLNVMTSVPPGAPAFPRVPPADWPQRCAFMENTMVLPEARGFGYQRLLLKMRIAEAKARGVHWLCAGVHLSNAPSLRNLFATGFAIVGMRNDHGYPVFGLLRHAHDSTVLATDGEDLTCAPLHRAQPHRCALETNYIGVRMHGAAIIYARSRTPLTAPVVFD